MIKKGGLGFSDDPDFLSGKVDKKEQFNISRHRVKHNPGICRGGKMFFWKGKKEVRKPLVEKGGIP